MWILTRTTHDYDIAYRLYVYNDYQFSIDESNLFESCIRRSTRSFVHPFVSSLLDLVPPTRVYLIQYYLLITTSTSVPHTSCVGITIWRPRMDYDTNSCISQSSLFTPSSSSQSIFPRFRTISHLLLLSHFIWIHYIIGYYHQVSISRRDSERLIRDMNMHHLTRDEQGVNERCTLYGSTIG